MLRYANGVKIEIHPVKVGGQLKAVPGYVHDDRCIRLITTALVLPVVSICRAAGEGIGTIVYAGTA